MSDKTKYLDDFDTGIDTGMPAAAVVIAWIVAGVMLLAVIGGFVVAWMIARLAGV